MVFDAGYIIDHTRQKNNTVILKNNENVYLTPYEYTIMNVISEEEKLNVIGIGGCWFAEESKEAYDTFEELKKHYTGPHRYLCSDDAPIANPKKYDFFNPTTNRGFLVSGGCWFSPSAKVGYDSMEDCSKYHGDCECICKDEYRNAF